MGKHIGNLKHPDTGNSCYIDIDMLKHISLAKSEVAVAGTRNGLAINFELKYEDGINDILLKAVLRYQDRVIESDTYPINALEFAQLLFDIVVKEDEDNYVDNYPLVAEPKEAAKNEIIGKLLDEHILLLNSDFKGIGFVTVSGDKVITIDEIHVEREMVDSSTNIALVLKNCCGIVQLANLSDPSVIFYSNGKTFNVNSFTVAESSEGRVKQYTVHCPRVDIDDVEMPNEYAEVISNPIDNGKLNRDEYVDAIMAARMDLLDEDNDEDDMANIFGDITF